MLHPIVTDELINKLRDLFPAAANRRMTQREIDHLIGQQEVINFLAQLLEEQKNEPLNVEEL